MVRYIIEPSDKKPVSPLMDDLPLFFGDKDKQPCTRQNIYELEGDDLIAKGVEELKAKYDRVEEFKKNRDFGGFLKDLDCRWHGEVTPAQYNMQTAYYKDFNPALPKMADGMTLRPNQQLIADWAKAPYEVDGRNGMWLNWPSGAGKTAILRYLIDNSSVYIPGKRPDGGYDENSFMNYNNEDIILLDELQPFTKEEWSPMHGCNVIKPFWKGRITQLLKTITEFFPISCFFGGVTTTVVLRAKIIVTSNFPYPTDGSGAVERRYILKTSTNVTPQNILKSDAYPKLRRVPDADVEDATDECEHVSKYQKVDENEEHLSATL